MSLMLTGLRGDTPVGFMAGVGLIRILPGHCRLAWDPVTRMAILVGIEREPLLAFLVDHMRDRHRSPELALRDDVRKLPAEDYRAMVARADPATLSWIRAWWREDGDEIVPTDLCLTGGPQRMIKMARELAQALDPAKGRGGENRVRKRFAEALFGPWTYTQPVASWGWDPVTFRPGATTHDAPTRMKTEGVEGAYWLAWESQPFFPNVPGQGTLGFRKKPERHWSWPVWAAPLDAAAVRAFLRRPEEAPALGGARYQSMIAFAGQIQCFRPANRAG